MRALFLMAPMMMAACATDDLEGETTQAATRTHVWTQRGQSVSVNLNGETSGGYLTAFEGGSSNTRLAYLSYYIFSADPASRVCETYDYGWGQFTYCRYTRWTSNFGGGEIATNDFRVGAHGGKLATTIGPNFYSERCTQDYVAGTSECTSAIGDRIELTFVDDGVSSRSDIGTTEITYGSVTSRTTGQARSASGLASGTIFGVSVPNVPALLSDSRGTNIVHELITN